jgi:hypothetical protein
MRVGYRSYVELLGFISVKIRVKVVKILYILVNTVFFYSFSCNLFPNTW